MFSKPNILIRKDNVSNKDARSPGNAQALSPSNQALRPAPAPASASVPAPVAVSETPAPPNPVVANTNEQVSGARLIVGPDVKLKGAEILDCDTLVVEGCVEATMDSRVIRIAENGSFAGKVSIDIAEIHGHFEGDLTARTQLIIHSTGRVSGKIRYGKLVIDEGGELCGDINALSSESTPAVRPRHEGLPTLSTVAA